MTCKNYIAVGVDIESIARFENLPFAQNKAFYQKVFTKKEIGYCLKRGKPSQHFAVRFAAKEAVFKALSSFNVKIGFGQIEILLNKNRVPVVKIRDNKPSKKNKFEDYEIKISISHSADSAVANAIVYKKRQ